MKENSTKLLTRLAFLIALSAVAAYVPLPSPTGTVALDSAPGYFAVLLFGGYKGAIVLAVGHIFSSLKTGFPLGALHLLIAILMGGCGFLFSLLKKKLNIIISSVITILLNGVVLPLILIPILGYGFFAAMLLPLLTGSLLNVFVAVVLYRLLKNKLEGVGDENKT